MHQSVQVGCPFDGEQLLAVSLPLATATDVYLLSSVLCRTACNHIKQIDSSIINTLNSLHSASAHSWCSHFFSCSISKCCNKKTFTLFCLNVIIICLNSLHQWHRFLSSNLTLHGLFIAPSSSWNCTNLSYKPFSICTTTVSESDCLPARLSTRRAIAKHT